MSNFSYESLLQGSKSYSLAEDVAPYKCLSERHAQVMWLEQKYFQNLTTESGELIQVISPGIWNNEAGPDFLKAHLRIGSETYRGDVEIHLQQNDWYNHKHHLDPRYDNVILHIAFWSSSKQTNLLTSQGRSVNKAYFVSHLTTTLEQIIDKIDIELYPYREFLGSGRCAREFFCDAPDETLKAFFMGTFIWRLAKKQKYLAKQHSLPELQFAAGIARALGYKQNGTAFIELFHWLLAMKCDNEDLLLAYALSATGFFSEKYQIQWQSSQKYQYLRALVTGAVVPSIALHLHQVRPANHPIRRLALLVKMLTNKHYETLYYDLMGYWHRQWSRVSSAKEWKKFYKNFIAYMPDFIDDYWNYHHAFEPLPKSSFLALYGLDMKNIIFVNVVLPLLFDRIVMKSNPLELKAFEQLCLNISGNSNSKSEYLTHRFFGNTPKGKWLSKTYAEQAAYQLHQDFCSKYEASCEGCPFVQNYHETLQYMRGTEHVSHGHSPRHLKLESIIYYN